MGVTPAVAGRGQHGPGAPSQRIYLHIGEPKTGTTFLQDALWANRRRLAGQGVQLPGYNDRDHFRASRDLRGTPRRPDDPADPWHGEWDVLAGQALRVPGTAVISNELLAACTPEQAERAVRSLLGAELHIVVTLRDFARLLPAEWQESVKVGQTAGWDEWIDDVRAAETLPDRRDQSWFWRVHDTPDVLTMWSRLIPHEHVHVITVPRPRAPGLLWERFAETVGFDPAGCDLTSVRRNASLGIAETEFLRRMNKELPGDLPDWFYVREIKQILALGVLRAREQSSTLTLTTAEHSWAAERAERVIAALREAGYDIVGDAAELRPATEPEHGHTAAPARPASANLAQQLDAAVQATVALGVRCYQAQYQATRPQRGPRTARQVLSDIKWKTLNGRRTRKVLRYASRLAAVRRLRVIIWVVLMHPGRSAGATARPAASAGAPVASVPRIPITMPDQALRDRDSSTAPPA